MMFWAGTSEDPAAASGNAREHCLDVLNISISNGRLSVFFVPLPQANCHGPVIEQRLALLSFVSLVADDGYPGECKMGDIDQN